MIPKIVPEKMFFTTGIGLHRHKLASFEQALRKAGIQKLNLVKVSSIFAPKCVIIPKTKGIKMLEAGQITFCVMAESATCEPNQLIAAAVGLALPKNRRKEYGYLSERHSFGETGRKAGDLAEDLAATMLATTLGLEFDADTAWRERQQVYKASGQIISTRNFCQSAEGNKDGLWTTVIAAAVFVC